MYTVCRCFFVRAIRPSQLTHEQAFIATLVVTLVKKGLLISGLHGSIQFDNSQMLSFGVVDFSAIDLFKFNIK